MELQDFSLNDFDTNQSLYIEASAGTGKTYTIQLMVAKMIAENRADLKVLPTDEKWIGMTYKEDKIDVVNKIAKLAQDGIYHKNLWN